MEERRQEKRFLYQTLVKYENGEDFEQLDAFTINLSSEGISMITSSNIELGSIFKLRFKLINHSEPIAAECEVVHKKELESGYLLGCRINSLEGIDKEGLKGLLESTFKKIDI